MRTAILFIILSLCLISCRKDLSELNLKYNGVEYIDKDPYPRSFCPMFSLKFYAKYDIKMPVDSLGFVNYFLYCPQDNDFDEYMKDSIFYLRDMCFDCDNIKVDTIQNRLLYTVPVAFIKTEGHNDAPFDPKELLQFLGKESCVECKIIYTKLGKIGFSNSFYIPTKDILPLLEVQYIY